MNLQQHTDGHKMVHLVLLPFQGVLPTPTNPGRRYALPWAEWLPWAFSPSLSGVDAAIGNEFLKHTTQAMLRQLATMQQIGEVFRKHTTQAMLRQLATMQQIGEVFFQTSIHA